jgi:hypothetical protein
MRQQGALQEQKTSLKGQEGSFAQQFLDSLRQDEAKNILAASIASGKDLTAQERITETTAPQQGVGEEHGRFTQGRCEGQGPDGQPVRLHGQGVGGVQPDSAADHGSGQEGAARAGARARTPNPTSGPGSLTPSRKPRSSARSTRSCRSSRAPSVPTTSCGCTSPTAKNPLKKVIDPRVINIAFDVARRGGPVLAEREGRPRPRDPCRRALQAAQGRPQGSGAGDVPAAVDTYKGIFGAQ